MADPQDTRDRPATARDLIGLGLRFLVQNRWPVAGAAALPLALLAGLRIVEFPAVADRGQAIWIWLVPVTLVTALFETAVIRLIVAPPQSSRSITGFVRAAAKVGFFKLLLTLAIVMIGLVATVGLSTVLEAGLLLDCMMLLVLLLILVLVAPYFFVFIAAAAVGWPGGTGASVALAWKLGRRGRVPLCLAVGASLFAYGAFLLVWYGLVEPAESTGLWAWIASIIELALSLTFEGYMSALAAYFFLWRLESSSAMVGPIQP